jgi:hypothetical protein
MVRLSGMSSSGRIEPRKNSRQADMVRKREPDALRTAAAEFFSGAPSIRRMPERIYQSCVICSA